MGRPIVRIIDDDLVSRFAVTYKIEQSSMDFEVIGRPDAFHGLNSLRECLHANNVLPDIILLDLEMPDMDGWSFLRELEEMDGTLEMMGVYILSAFTGSEDRNIAKNNPLIRGFFDKPLSGANVQSILKDMKV
ncbi:MAG: response regulator [Pricia sp.]